jgi:hypothetical protein
VPILSVQVAARHANFALVAFVVVTALVHPIYWSPFFVVGAIGLARPTNVEDGLRWWIVVWISVLWKFSWETCFLTKFASLGLPFLVTFG